MSQVIVNRRGTERIQRGHLWIYQADIRAVEAKTGEVVQVRTGRGDLLGQAFYSEQSQIGLRMLTPLEEPVDEAFWRRRLESSLVLREGIASTTNAYRWIHGESDGIPSLIVDRYGDHVVLQTLSQGTERLKELFVRLIADMVQPAGILERNDPRVRALEGLPAVKNVLFGKVTETVTVREEGIRFLVDVWGGQKTGLFLDQRENHVAAARIAAGRALDVFCYDGGFALHLAKGCKEVLAVDASAEALARLRTNAEANNLSGIHAIEANAFDFLRDMADRGERFDTVVLDPPAFAKNKAAVPQALRGYKEINLRALKLLPPGGRLITCTCSHHIRETDFLDILTSAAVDVGARLVLLEKRMQSRDHPVLLTMPETHYLKCMMLQKL